MAVYNKSRELIARQLRKELPRISFESGAIKVREYQMEDLIDFVFNVFERGKYIGKEKAMTNLKRKIRKVLIN